MSRFRALLPAASLEDDVTTVVGTASHAAGVTVNININYAAPAQLGDTIIIAAKVRATLRAAPLFSQSAANHAQYGGCLLEGAAWLLTHRSSPVKLSRQCCKYACATF